MGARRRWATAGLPYADNGGARIERTDSPLTFRAAVIPTRITLTREVACGYNDGACDGWLRAGDNDDYAIGYYIKQDLAFFGDAAAQWTVCDRYFSAMMAATFPNRVYQHAAQTDRLENTFDLCTLPTIWDSLAAAKIEGRYYFSDVPFLALWGTEATSASDAAAEQFFDDAPPARCRPCRSSSRASSESTGALERRSSLADLRDGQAFLSRVYRAVTQESRLAEHRLRDQLRRVGRLLRPCAAADSSRASCRSVTR